MIFHAVALIAAIGFQTPGKVDIKDTVEGSGRAAQTKDIVTVEYTGTLMDGKEFDSSKGKAPIVFTLGAGQVIKGWDQGLVGLKTGGERDLVIPPDLAYGDEGGGPIPPKSTLKFHVKLLRIDREGDKAEIEQKVTAPGKGEVAAEGDVVAVHYTGTFLNGVKFDSSYDRKAPMRVITGHEHLIKGFVEGLKGIKEGEKRHVVIPASLGYGTAQRGPIPGGSTLIFDIEAVKITPKTEVAKQVEADRKKLKFENETAGKGADVHYGDTIQVHFSATLADGKNLGGTRETGQPLTYSVGSENLARGFDAALVGMKEGGKVKVTVPAELAFGDEGAGNGAIPPKSTVIFEIEVVKVNP
jgi:FKBP-type peptidyl-prolyl cis-trans isomerase